MPEEIFEKTEEGQLRVIKTVTEETEFHYNIDDLLKQRDQIEAMRIRDNAQRDKELKEVDALIDQCRRLGIEATAVSDVNNNDEPLNRR